MRSLRAFLRLVRMITLAASVEVPRTTNRLTAALGGPTGAAEIWWHIRATAAIFLTTPLVLITIALCFKSSTLVAITGLILALWLAFLLYRPAFIGLAAAIGAISNALKLRPVKGAKEWAEMLIKVFTSILLWELIIVCFITIFPVWENPGALPKIALFAIVVPLMVYRWGFGGNWFRGFAYAFVVAMLIFQIASLVFPKTTTAVAEKRPSADEGMANWIKNPTWPSPQKQNTADRPLARKIQEGTFELEPGQKEVTGMRAEARDLIEYYQLPGASFFSDGWREEITQEKKVLNSDGDGTIILTNGMIKNRIMVRVIPHGLS